MNDTSLGEIMEGIISQLRSMYGIKAAILSVHTNENSALSVVGCGESSSSLYALIAHSAKAVSKYEEENKEDDNKKESSVEMYN